MGASAEGEGAKVAAREPGSEAPLMVTKLSPPLDATAPLWARLARVLRRLVEGLYHHDGLSAAPAMAFHFFLSLFPLLVVVGWIVGKIARSRGVEVLVGAAFAAAPQAFATIGKRELERLAATDLSAAPLALVGFMWLASSGVHGMMDAFERALAVPKRRPYWKKRAIAITFVLAGLVALAFVAFASVGLESVAAAIPPSAPIVSQGPAGSSLVEAARDVGERVRLSFDHVLALSCFFGLAVSGVAVFYRFAVETSSVRRRVWPGATLAIVLWLVISWAFGAYVSSLGQYTLYYGSLAAVAVVLVWLWLTSLALLVGAELNAQLEGTRI